MPPPDQIFVFHNALLKWPDGSRVSMFWRERDRPSTILQSEMSFLQRARIRCILSIGGWGLIWTLIKMQSFLSRPTLSPQNPAATHFFTSRVLFAFFWFCSTYWVKPSIIFYFNSHSHQIPSFVLCPQRDLPSDAYYTMCVSAFPPRCKPTDPKPTSE